MAEEKILTFSKALPDKSEIRQVIAYILNLYCGQKLTFNSRKKLKKTMLKLSNGKNIELKLDKIVEKIISERKFNPKEFSLPPLESAWLDGIDSYGTTAINSEWNVTLPYGENFPIKPHVKGTGLIYTTFQRFLQKDIIHKYKWLIENSDKCFNINGEWLNEFRLIINDCVSVIDITLHQLYYFAEYKGKNSWKFNAQELSKQHGMRIEDKFKWINKITGQSLDDVITEKESFKKIKELRNHFNHFDPPCFAYSINDLVYWLNLIPDIGRLLWKIREKINEPITEEIISIITLSKVEILDKTRALCDNNDNSGYVSCQF